MLRSFISTSKQQNRRVAAPSEVNPITRSVVDFHLGNLAAKRFGASEISSLGTRDAGQDSRSRLSIAQRPQPLGESLGLKDFQLGVKLGH
jgi:hypothetical protein